MIVFFPFFCDLVSITLSEIQGSCLSMSNAPLASHILAQKIDRPVMHFSILSSPTSQYAVIKIYQIWGRWFSRMPAAAPLPDLLAGSWALGPSVCLDLSYPPHLGITGALPPPHSPPTLHVPEELGSSILKCPYAAKSSSTHGGAFCRTASCLVCSSKSQKIQHYFFYTSDNGGAFSSQHNVRVLKDFEVLSKKKLSFIQWKPGVMRRGRILI